MISNNGSHRFDPPPDSTPEEFFPCRETFYDFAGREITFEVSLHVCEDVPGFRLFAVEETDEDRFGYDFSAHDPVCPFHALGMLRHRIRRFLATRYLQELPDGAKSAYHGRLAGQIVMVPDDGRLGFVVDGQLLTLDEISKLALMYEGWQFKMEFIDPSDDLFG